MLGTGQQHWSTVHVADLADFFRRVLEDDSARGRYVIDNGLHPTVAELTEAAAAAVGAPGAVPGSDEEARARLGDYFAEVLLLDQGTDTARARASSAGVRPTRHLPTSSATAVTVSKENDMASRGHARPGRAPAGASRKEPKPDAGSLGSAAPLAVAAAPPTRRAAARAGGRAAGAVL